LRAEQACVFAVASHQGVVGALLGYAPVAQHDDDVSPADPAEAVADEQADLAGQQGVELLPLVGLGQRVQARRGSSRMKSRASGRITARASATRCHCPPDNCTPRRSRDGPGGPSLAKIRLSMLS
jgi:hypothetical protein